MLEHCAFKGGKDNNILIYDTKLFNASKEIKTQSK